MDKVQKINFEQKRYILAELNRYHNWQSKPDPAPLKKPAHVLRAEVMERKAKRITDAWDRQEGERKRKFEKEMSREIAKVRREALFGTPDSALKMLNGLNRRYPLKD